MLVGLENSASAAEEVATNHFKEGTDVEGLVEGIIEDRKRMRNKS